MLTNAWQTSLSAAILLHDLIYKLSKRCHLFENHRACVVRVHFVEELCSVCLSDSWRNIDLDISRLPPPKQAILDRRCSWWSDVRWCQVAIHCRLSFSHSWRTTVSSVFLLTSKRRGWSQVTVERPLRWNVVSQASEHKMTCVTCCEKLKYCITPCPQINGGTTVWSCPLVVWIEWQDLGFPWFPSQLVSTWTWPAHCPQKCQSLKGLVGKLRQRQEE